ncbi:MAG: hypothetical protein OXH76_16405 [Boseongicola sp.]|nr:hypothetical protein [Boseongicola sp.]
MTWRCPGGGEREALRDRGTQRDVRLGKEIDLSGLASDLVDVFMPAASGSLLVCTAGLMAVIGLWADTEHILGKLLAGPVRAPVALLRIAFGGQRRSVRPDGRVGGLQRRMRAGGAWRHEPRAEDHRMADPAC